MQFGYDFPPDGISGLAFPEISSLSARTLMQNLNESSQLPRRFFSFRLSTTLGQSHMIIGDADYTAFKNDTLVSVNVTKEGYWQVLLGWISRPDHVIPETIDQPAIIDTGTTLILMPSATADRYYSGIPGVKSTEDGLYTSALRLYINSESLHSTSCSSMLLHRFMDADSEIWRKSVSGA